MSCIRLERVDVHFGGLQALNHLSIRIDEGDIHGLIGPNGAGKTTVINVLSRLIQPTSGHVELFGAPMPKRPPHQLRKMGVSRTFQTPAVFQELTALENVMVGSHSFTSAGLFRSLVRTPHALREARAVTDGARQMLERIGFDGAPTAMVSTLSFANQRRVELARALVGDPRLLLLDEPTAGFTTGEVDQFAQVLRQIHSEYAHPLTILIVEHNVPFIFGLCDRVTAMDEGRQLAEGKAAEVRADPAVLHSYLRGYEEEDSPPSRQRQNHLPAAMDSRTSTTAPTRSSHLEAADLVAGYGSVIAVRQLSFSVNREEVVAIVGRNGAGKSTLLNALAGLVRPRSGQVRWKGRRIERMSPQAIVKAGIGLVPQDRAVIERQSVTDNLRLATFGMRLGKAEVVRRIEAMFGRFPKLRERQHQLAGRLSGGERQMLAIAKVLIRHPELLMLDEPSIGLAPTVVQELRTAVAQIKREGTTVLIAEQNVAWVLALATRAYLLETGTITREGAVEDLTEAILAGQFLGE